MTHSGGENAGENTSHFPAQNVNVTSHNFDLLQLFTLPLNLSLEPKNYFSRFGHRRPSHPPLQPVHLLAHSFSI